MKRRKPVTGRPEKVWVYVGARAGKKPAEAKRRVVTAACEELIGDCDPPTFLPAIHPATDHNDPINIYGKWLGNKYRFITRYRCVRPNAPEEFDAPFARLECGSRDNYDVSWHRRTGERHTVFQDLDLSGAMDALKAEFFIRADSRLPEITALDETSADIVPPGPACMREACPGHGSCPGAAARLHASPHRGTA